MDSNFKSIKSPMQLAGFYLAWIETVLMVSLWTLKRHTDLQIFLLYIIFSIAIIFSLTMVFVLIYLTFKEPRSLFNPADYDSRLQDKFFNHDHTMSEARIAIDETSLGKVGANDEQS